MGWIFHDIYEALGKKLGFSAKQYRLTEVATGGVL